MVGPSKRCRRESFFADATSAIAESRQFPASPNTSKTWSIGNGGRGQGGDGERAHGKYSSPLSRSSLGKQGNESLGFLTLRFRVAGQCIKIESERSGDSQGTLDPVFVKTVAPVGSAKTDAGLPVDFVEPTLRVQGPKRKNGMLKLEPLQHFSLIDLTVGIQRQAEWSRQTQTLQPIQVVGHADLLSRFRPECGSSNSPMPVVFAAAQIRQRAVRRDLTDREIR